MKARLGWQEPPEEDQRKLEIQVLTRSLTILNVDIKYFFKKTIKEINVTIKRILNHKQTFTSS